MGKKSAWEQDAIKMREEMPEGQTLFESDTHKA
jgi:hypothetical protein